MNNCRNFTQIFSNIMRVIDLGTGTSFTVTQYAGYQKFTADNFIAGVISAPSIRTDYPNSVRYARAHGFTLSKSYNASTGILTVSGASQLITCLEAEVPATQYLVVRAYLVMS